MAYVDPNTVHNPTTGQAIPASWGDIIRDDLEWLAGGMPHATISEATAQSIANVDWTALTSNDAEIADIGGMHSTSADTSRLTVPSGGAGLYVASCAVTFAFNATGERFVGFGKNGADPTFSVNSTNAMTSSGTSIGGSAEFNLVAGDYLECMVFHNRGSALNCTLNRFSVRWVAEQ